MCARDRRFHRINTLVRKALIKCTIQSKASVQDLQGTQCQSSSHECRQRKVGAQLERMADLRGRGTPAS